ncbi:MAG TPA: hypothetical protein VLY24_30635 [Bryobacteraceae bacterium]|nr:hypothetical protein [Bryobacteraceae bacterium]
MGNRLEEELARQLRPVAAPAGLWLRIEGSGPVAAGAMLRWPVWALAAAVAAMIALFCFSLRSDTGPYMAKAAARELARGADQVEFRSADPGAIRAWVKANAGFDVALPAEVPAQVKIVGVSVLRNGSPMVCVTYRVGNRPSRLLVARAAAAAQHRSMEQTRYGAASVSTWAIGGQMYALASAAQEKAHGGCVLCHS